MKQTKKSTAETVLRIMVSVAATLVTMKIVGAI